MEEINSVKEGGDRKPKKTVFFQRSPLSQDKKGTVIEKKGRNGRRATRRMERLLIQFF